jgi:TonB family protein
MNITLRKIISLGLAFVCTAFLVLSIPFFNQFVKQPPAPKEDPTPTAITIREIRLETPEPQQTQERVTPSRTPPSPRSPKGPMKSGLNLQVAGAGGAGISTDLLAPMGGSGGNNSGVDQAPRPQGEPMPRVPRAIAEAEISAAATLQWCVDAQGRVYNMQIVSESPTGMGMGAAAAQAITSLRFSPALIDQQPVSFCGMEQTIRIEYN